MDDPLSLDQYFLLLIWLSSLEVLQRIGKLRVHTMFIFGGSAENLELGFKKYS